MYHYQLTVLLVRQSDAKKNTQALGLKSEQLQATAAAGPTNDNRLATLTQSPQMRPIQ
jgi:hypothetical protein